MTEFCPPCPLRGECQGEIVKQVEINIPPRFRKRAFLGCVLLDADGRPSEPIYHKGNDRDVIGKIGNCPGQPETNYPFAPFSTAPDAIDICTPLGRKRGLEIRTEERFVQQRYASLMAEPEQQPTPDVG